MYFCLDIVMGLCFFYLEPVIPTYMYLTRCFYFSWNCLSNLKILWENSGMFHPIKISLKARCRKNSLRDINAGDFFLIKRSAVILQPVCSSVSFQWPTKLSELVLDKKIMGYLIYSTEELKLPVNIYFKPF